MQKCITFKQIIQNQIKTNYIKVMNKIYMNCNKAQEKMNKNNITNQHRDKNNDINKKLIPNK